jgi:ubiquitin-protein ligase
MSCPNLDDPLEQNIAAHFRSDLDGALKTAKSWVSQYAIE